MHVQSTWYPLLETLLQFEPDTATLEQFLTPCKDAVSERTSSAAEELDFTKEKVNKPLMANANVIDKRAVTPLLAIASRRTIASVTTSTSS